MIGVPKGRRWIDGFTTSLLGLLLYEGNDPKYQLHLRLAQSPEQGLSGKERFERIGQARTRLLEEALALDVAAVLFLDDDMTFPPDTIRRLLAVEKPYVTGVAFLKSDPYPPNILHQTTRRDPKTGLIHERYRPILEYPQAPFPIDASGLACCLVRMAAVKTLRRPWFGSPELTQDSDIGEDVSFSRRFWEAGHELWCEPSLQIGHIRPDGRVITQTDFQNALKAIQRGGEDDGKWI